MGPPSAGFSFAQATKKPALAAGLRSLIAEADGNRSGAETCGFDQADLIAACREFATLVALHHYATTGFHTDHPGTNPAEGG